MELSNRVKSLKPSPTLAVGARANQLRAEGKEILNLSLGEPDFPTPAPIQEAGQRAILEGKTTYTPVAGISALREAIADFLKRHKQLNYTASNIVVSTGAKQSLYNAIMSVVGPEDEVIIPTPFWVSYTTQVELAGGTPVLVYSKIEDNFQLNVDDIEAAITPKTKMVIVNSPNNPTGAVYSKDCMQALANLLMKHPNIWLLCDDIYDQLVYGGLEATNPLQFEASLQERSIIINGFSKAYAMTGWRMGYMAAPEPVVKAAIALQGAATSGPNAPTQYAALKALDESLNSTILEMRDTFADRLTCMKEAFGSIPNTTYSTPDGAFYLMVDFTQWLGSTTPSGTTISNTLELATYLLEEGLVAGVPGEAFGVPGTIRFAYSTNKEIIRKASEHITQALQKLALR